MVYSFIKTASAPFGIGAPVAITIASPFLTVLSEKSPAPIASIILNSFGADCEAPNVSSPINANPSIADLSKGGES